MLILYTRTGCGFCERVRAYLVRANLTYTEREITDPTAYAKLVAKGGKAQVPFLVDTDRNTAKYESLDIIEYLHTTYAPLTPPGPVARVTTCPVF